MGEQKRVEYAIVIPAYNEESLLPRTIVAARDLMSSIDSPGELIVVDNNSTDSTAAVAENLGVDRIIFEPHNQIARARNAGAAATSAKYLVFIDADTVVPEETFLDALDMLKSGKVAGGGARIIMDQPVTPIVGWILGGWNRVAETFGYAAGSFFFCRRDAFDSVGGFDEAVYAGEEVWLARRIKGWGRKRNLKFRVISNPPVETSGRKSDWFSDREFVLQLAVLFFFPWATRSRRLCRVWYRRPEHERPRSLCQDGRG